ncbi:ATP-binding protein [Desulfococcus sp.]|uniref:sensor histidine kinase n=1 Tax=Desulfococcus sp. TaxID=2025834 RepID=UPI003592FE33
MSEKRVDGSYYQHLTRRIMLVLIGVSIIPLALISFFLLRQFQQSYQERLYAHLGELVLKHEQNIDAFLAEKLSDIRFLAGSFPFEKFQDERFLENRLALLQREYGTVFEDLGVVDEYGRQLSYAGPYELESADYAGADWFRKAIASRHYVSDVFLGLRAKPHFIVSVRHQSPEGYWILRSTISFLSFNSLVENLRMGRTGMAFILNKDGQFQTRPPAGSNGGDQRRLYELIKGGKRYANEIHIVERKDPETGSISVLVGAFLKGEDWLLVYQQDKADALSNHIKAQRVAIIILCIAGLCVLLTVMLLSRVIVNRFVDLDREKELMNQQIIETGKLASVGELASGIAHEINNPVAIMMEEAGWIEDLLAEENLDHLKNAVEIQRSLKQIHDQGVRCKEITHKLLSFARKSDSRAHELQLNELIEEVVALSEKQARYDNVLIETSLQEDLPTVHVSSTEIQQILLNLINNAIYAIHKKGINGKIEIKTSLKGGNIVIDIADNGCGIPAANMSRIFDPFFTTKPVGKGSGLGLSICYGIVKKMGGDIDVKSAVDEGTKFCIRLPAFDKKPPDTPAE